MSDAAVTRQQTAFPIRLRYVLDTQDDVAAGARIYYRMDLLALAYPRMQIIVADNGFPRLESQILRRLNIIELSYDRPLLRDVPHPGRAQAEEDERHEAQRRKRS